MKIGILLLIFSLAQFVFAGPNEITSDCRNYAKKTYFVNGKWDSSVGGDRLWNFPKLTKKFKSSDAARCDRESFTQALKDSTEYWGHIEEKYKCPESKVKQCDLSETNLNYLQLCKATYSEKLKDVHEDILVCGQIAPPGKEVEGFVQDNVETLSHVTPKKENNPVSEEDTDTEEDPEAQEKAEMDMCPEDIPEEYKKKDPKVKDDTSSLSAILKGAGHCFWGALKGGKNSIRDFFSSVWEILRLSGKVIFKTEKMMISFLKAAYYGTIPQFIAETTDEGSKFVSDMITSVSAIWMQALAEGMSNITAYNCMNGAGQAELACRAISHLGVDLLISSFTMGANKAKLLSFAKKAIKSKGVTNLTQPAIARLSKLNKTMGGGSIDVKVGAGKGAGATGKGAGSAGKNAKGTANNTKGNANNSNTAKNNQSGKNNNKNTANNNQSGKNTNKNTANNNHNGKNRNSNTANNKPNNNSKAPASNSANAANTPDPTKKPSLVKRAATGAKNYVIKETKEQVKGVYNGGKWVVKKGAKHSFLLNTAEDPNMPILPPGEGEVPSEEYTESPEEGASEGAETEGTEEQAGNEE